MSADKFVGNFIVNKAVGPLVVFLIAVGNGQIRPAALVAGTGGLGAPDIGLQVYPAAAFGFPFVADFMAFGVNGGIEHLRRYDQRRPAGEVELVAEAQQYGVVKGVVFAETDAGAHMAEADFLIVGQIPVVFQQQAFARHVTVEHFFTGAVELRHVRYHGRPRIAEIRIVRVVFRIVQIAARPAFSAEVIAFFAVAVSNQAV